MWKMVRPSTPISDRMALGVACQGTGSTSDQVLVDSKDRHRIMKYKTPLVLCMQDDAMTKLVTSDIQLDPRAAEHTLQQAAGPAKCHTICYITFAPPTDSGLPHR